jgi:membrane peptidoglycan carboxypeptidase
MPYFTDYVSSPLLSQYGEQETLTAVSRSARRSIRMQRDAESAVYKYLSSANQPRAALVVIDPRSGQVRAMVAAFPKRQKVINYALDACRQAGSCSSLHPDAALEDRISPNSTWAAPVVTINNPVCDTNGFPWQPQPC